MKIAVIIPALNEAEALPRVLAATKEVCAQFDQAQVIVVDNGSTDATAEVARAGEVSVVEELRRVCHHAVDRRVAQPAVLGGREVDTAEEPMLAGDPLGSREDHRYRTG